MARIALNGLGRIGKLLLRRMFDEGLVRNGDKSAILSLSWYFRKAFSKVCEARSDIVVVP